MIKLNGTVFGIYCTTTLRTMRTIFILFILLFTSNYVLACDCEKPKIALEFYNSEYVFKGKVTQKVYSDDLSSYLLTVKVINHYKIKDSLPKEFQFSFRSKHNYNKNSCAFFIDKYESLLLYIKKDDNSYNFSLMCSNSKRITNKPIGTKELAILENFKKFNLNNYILENEKGFSYSKPITNVDSIISTFKKNKIEKKQFSIVIVDIDEKGKLISANLHYKLEPIKYKIIDSIFGLNYLINKQYRKPENNFESVILNVSKKITDWIPYRNLKTGETVRHRKYLKFQSSIKGELIFEY